MYEKCDPTLEEVLQNSTYPVTAYLKYNGYLGLLSYDFVNNDFFIATKSTNQGDYKNWFKEILKEKNILTDELKKYLQDNGVTMVFEVIDPVNDPHIIEYAEKGIVLLDIIQNSFEYVKCPYNEVVEVAKQFNLISKAKLEVLKTQDELKNFIDLFDDMYGEKLEGAVFEDANGYMFKYKTSYYKFWKEMRKLKDDFARGRAPKKIYKDANWISFYKFLEKLTPEELNKDIITLRKEWEMDNEIY